MKKLKLYFLFIIPWLLIFSCKKEDDKIEPVEIPFHSRVEIDYSGIVIQDGESITIDGVTYSHKLNLADPTSVLDSGFLMTTYSGDSVNAVIDIIKLQNGDTVKYVFKRKPDLSIVSPGEYIKIDNAVNANNNGIFLILSVDTASGSIEVTNTERTNSTEDESNSTAIATIQDPELITSQVVDIITGDTITITVGTIFTDKKTILIDKINYHAPGGSLLLQLYRDNRFVVDTTKIPFIDTIAPFQTADSITKPQKTRIYPDLVGVAVAIDDIWALTIGTVTITFVATLPTIAHVTAGLTKAVNDELSNPGGNLSSILSPAIDMQTYIELIGIDSITTFTVIAFVNGVELFTPYATDKYILKIKGGGEMHLGTVSEYQLDLRAKTIQIESKTGAEIKINTSYGVIIKWDKEF